ncbi:DNA-processing protein DprA [Candidatus Saccharibacteria bacterium]|nr:DNA-processing protein DprA [Candidatus Saccharibacteria bacterium]
MSTLFSHFFEKINQISPLEHNFTEVLDSIALKPKTLYFRGKIPENVLKNDQKIRPKTVAIVGSRHNTKYGEEVAYRLAHELGKRGAVVISGLAYGIDSIGHRGCLDAGGVTIAVLGTPIDQIYPRNHTPLAREIIEKDGAIISEYAPGAQIYTKVSFLERNRIISGLADIVVVVEAAEKSGSLNTATHAINQGKEVFAVPGNITNPYSQGCNKLIKQGAIPYTEPDDILRELFHEDFAKKYHKLKQAKLFGDTDAETAILRALAAGARSGDEIMKLSLLPPEVFNQAITLLEIKSRVRSLGMNNWGLI